MAESYDALLTEGYPHNNGEAVVQVKAPPAFARTKSDYDDAKVRDYNEDAQLLLKRAAPTPYDEKVKANDFRKLAKEFTDEAAAMVKDIVAGKAEQYRCKEQPGILGGDKYKKGGIFYKWAKPLPNTDSNAYHARCVQSNEFRTLDFVNQTSGVSNLCVPLCTLFTYKGQTIIAVAGLPIDETTLCYGSGDAGITILCHKHAEDMIRPIADRFHLKRHRVGSTTKQGRFRREKSQELLLAADVEVHKSNRDGRYYLIDSGRVFPPQSYRGTEMFAFLLRPEFLIMYDMSRLSSDAFSRFADPEERAENDQEVRAAIKHLCDVSLKNAAADIVEHPPEDGNEISSILHRNGVNVRLMAYVLDAITDVDTVKIQECLVAEMVRRCVKQHLYMCFSEITQPDMPDDHFRDVGRRHVLPALSVQEEEHKQELMIYDWVKAKFPFPPSQSSSSCWETVCVPIMKRLLGDKDWVSTLVEGEIDKQLQCHARQLDAPPAMELKDAEMELRRELRLRGRSLPDGEKNARLLPVYVLLLKLFQKFSNDGHEETSKKAQEVIATMDEIIATTGDRTHVADEEEKKELDTMVAASFVAIGQYLDEYAQYEDSKRYWDRCYEMKIDDAVTQLRYRVEAALGLTKVLRKQKSKTNAALKFCQEALELAPEVKDHPLLEADAHNQRGLLCLQTRQYDDAIADFARVIQVAGEDDMMYKARSLNNIGLAYRKKRDYDKALEFFQQSLDVKKRAFGETHTTTAEALNNLGLAHWHKKDYPRALELYEECLQAKESVYGREHPTVARTLNNIALVYSKDKDQLNKALEYYERCLAIECKVHDENHKSVARTRSNMSIVFRKMGRYDDALQCCTKALQVREEVFDEINGSTLSTVFEMGEIYTAKQDYGNALKYYERALHISTELYGSDHKDTKTVLDRIAKTKENEEEQQQQ